MERQKDIHTLDIDNLQGLFSYCTIVSPSETHLISN